MSLQFNGIVSKMRVELTSPVNYQLPVGQHKISLNPLLGHRMVIRYHGMVSCLACGRQSRKSYSQGYCYPCSQRLACCDLCIMKPETCHYFAGTCREPSWGEAHCMIPHYVYLANTGQLKVGITRHTQLHTRWIDQGATQAIPMCKVETRKDSGALEVLFKHFVADRGQWRKMLQNAGPELDLAQQRVQLQLEAHQLLESVDVSYQWLDAPAVSIDYPVLTYPEKIKSLNLDKTPQIEGRLQGIKGQYLILDSGVLNIRKYTGYMIDIEVFDRED